MGQIYFLIFWIPAIASVILLYLNSQSGLLPRPGKFVLWFGLALLLQIVSGLFSPLWTVGLVLQVLLGIFLTMRMKLA